MVNPVKAFSYFLIYNIFFIFILSSLGFLTTRNGADHPRTTPASAADTAQGSFLFFNVNMEQSPHVLLITPSTLATSEKEKYRRTHTQNKTFWCSSLNLCFVYSEKFLIPFCHGRSRSPQFLSLQKEEVYFKPITPPSRICIWNSSCGGAVVL